MRKQKNRSCSFRATKRGTRARPILQLFAVSLLLFVVAGCGGNSVAGPVPTPTPTPAPTPNPSPSVATLSPSNAAAGGPAFTLTVDGENFVPASVVEWNGSSRSTTFVNSGQLTAKIAAGDIALAGRASINVVNPAPGGGASSSFSVAILSTSIVFDSDRALDGSDAANGVPNIWVVNADGTNATPLTRLTAVAATSVGPVWSPDGSKLAFSSARALDGSDAANTNDTPNIWVVNADGTNATPLTRLTAPGAASFGPVWSRDGSKVALVSERALNGSDAANTNDTPNIWVVNADGTNATPLTQLTAPFAASFGPVWSPDGSKIAFRSGRALNGSDAANPNFTSNIWVINADGTNAVPLTRLTAFGTDSFGPVWSPDGSKVVFFSSRALDGSDATNTVDSIWVVSADGTNAVPLTRLTVSGANSADPAWSPDGGKIAFASARALDGSDAANTNGTVNIWLVDADGTNATPLTRVTAQAAGSGFPAWSPDGSKITFTSGRALDGGNAANTNGTFDGAFNVWVMNADGSEPAPLTKITAPTVTLGGNWRP